MDQSHLSCPQMSEVVSEPEITEKEEKNVIYKLRKPLELVSKYQEYLAQTVDSEEIENCKENEDDMESGAELQRRFFEDFRQGKLKNLI